MIRLIYGDKGSGKTAQLVADANQATATAKGIIVYVDKSNGRMHDLDHAVKLVDAREFGITDQSQFIAFIKGMVAGNYDIETIYIDNIEKITNQPNVLALEDIFSQIENLIGLLRVKFVITVSCTAADMPQFLRKYL